MWAKLALQPSPKDTSDGEYKITKVYTLMLSKLTVMLYTSGKYMYMF